MKYSVRPYRPGEELYVAQAHKRIYTEEYRWGDSFTGYAMKIAMDFPDREKTDREELWIAEAGGRPVGCIMLSQTEEPTVGQLRLFLVEKAYRGFGIGAALTGALLERAGAVGYERLVLWTASPLRDALRQYEKLGFRFVEEAENRQWSMDGEPLKEIKLEKLL